MDIAKVSKEVQELITYLDSKKLKIDEKIAICRGAGDVLSQVMIMEVTTVSMTRQFQNLYGDK